MRSRQMTSRSSKTLHHFRFQTQRVRGHHVAGHHVARKKVRLIQELFEGKAGVSHRIKSQPHGELHADGQQKLREITDCPPNETAVRGLHARNCQLHKNAVAIEIRRKHLQISFRDDWIRMRDGCRCDRPQSCLVTRRIPGRVQGRRRLSIFTWGAGHSTGRQAAHCRQRTTGSCLFDRPFLGSVKAEWRADFSPRLNISPVYLQYGRQQRMTRVGWRIMNDTPETSAHCNPAASFLARGAAVGRLVLLLKPRVALSNGLLFKQKPIFTTDDEPRAETPRDKLNRAEMRRV